jgi:hypothetical protein
MSIPVIHISVYARVILKCVGRVAAQLARGQGVAWERAEWAGVWLTDELEDSEWKVGTLRHFECDGRLEITMLYSGAHHTLKYQRKAVQHMKMK